MRFLQQAVLAAGIINAADALNLKRSDNPKVLAAPIKRQPVTNHVQRDLQRREYLSKRAKTLNVDISNGETLYLVKLSIGTPPQSVQLHLDTGSSDLWVNIANSQYCQSVADSQASCESYGVYDESKSSSYNFVNNDFNITYADGSGATGNYGTETVTINGATIKNQQFGVGNISSTPQGILGVGYPADEAQVVQANGPSYANVPKSLANNGVINVDAYSLWLDDLDAQTGTILFGGVDTAKYTGKLQTFPVLQAYGQFADLLIGLTGVGINGKSISSQHVAALLDSGTSLTYLPTSIANQIVSQFSGTYNSQIGAYNVDCSLSNQSGSVDYSFGSLTITVPLSQLVEVSGGTNLDPQCILGIAPTQGNLVILGDTFLRNAYVVYDLANNQISMAPSNFNAGNSNIMEITSNGVPDAEGAQNAVTTASGITTGLIPATVVSTNLVVGTGSPGSPTHKGAAAAMATPPLAYGMAAAAAGIGAVFAL